MPSAGEPSESSEATRRQEILEIAAKLFASTGYRGTSLQNVADAAGILPGSLYHHFASKEALAVELVEAFHEDLGGAAQAFEPAADPLDALRQFAELIARVGDRHQAALQLCVYDAPTSASATFHEVVRHEPAVLQRRWREVTRRAVEDGRFRRAAVDERLLRVCLRHGASAATMLPTPRYDPVAWADQLVDLMFDGLVVGEPALVALDSSTTSEVVRKVAAGWQEAAVTRRQNRRQLILDAARHEFARRGFEATTIRDVAEAAGVPASSLYRHFDSKTTMLSEIIEQFSHQLLGGFHDVIDAGATATERLDGLIWLMIHAGRTFRSEYQIVKAWWQLANPTSPDCALQENQERFTLLRELLGDGIRTGELRAVDDVDLLSRCLRDVLWMSHWGSGQVAPKRARDFLRQTILLGAARP